MRTASVKRLSFYEATALKNWSMLPSKKVSTTLQ